MGSELHKKKHLSSEHNKLILKQSSQTLLFTFCFNEQSSGGVSDEWQVTIKRSAALRHTKHLSIINDSVSV